MTLDWCQNCVSIQYQIDWFWWNVVYADLGENVSFSVKLVVYRVLFPGSCQIHVPSTEFRLLMAKSCSSLMSGNKWGLLPIVHTSFFQYLQNKANGVMQIVPWNLKVLYAFYGTSYYTWASSWQNVASGVSDQARHKPACAATEAS